MESSARAFAFTGVRLFHDRVFVHQQSILGKLDEVQALLADNPVQSARVSRLRVLAEAKFAQSDRLMELREKEGEAAAARFLAELPTDQTSALVGLADEVQEVENRLLTERERTRALVERNTHASQALGGALALALLGISVTTALRAMGARAAAESELRKSERMFQMLFESSPDAVVLVGGDGRIVRVNGRARDLFGWQDGTLAGESLNVLLPDRIRVRHGGHLERFLRDPQARPMGSGLELFCRRRDGSEFPVDVMLSPVEAGEGAHVVAVVRDISERKQAEADRLVLSKLESTGILAEGIAHDFNNLLTVILLNIDLADSNPGSDLAGASLGGARKATIAARGLTKQLITFAQGGDPVCRPTNVESLLRDAAALAASGSTVSIRFDIAPGLRAAEIDEGQIAQVIRNLVLNAREAMPDKGTITVAAENAAPGQGIPAGLAPGDYLHLSVADEGTGIPDDIRPRIFDPYFTTKQRGNRKGMGLGLTICYSIVKKHGGDITVETAVGRGTTFHLYLPASRGAAPAREASHSPAPSPARRAKILVMDDEEMVRDTVGTIIGMSGHTVVLASEGGQAVELYLRAHEAGEPFDLVILDLTVRAGMGGVAAARRLLEINPAVKMAVMSGYSDDGSAAEYAREGFVATLPKPFSVDRINGMLSEFL
jgi:PAS domain S-box-containing protein